MRSRMFVSLALVASVSLVGAACGENEPSSTRADAAPAEDAPVEVSPQPTKTSSSHDQAKHSGGKSEITRAEVIDTDFRPKTIKVAVGDKVKWTQIGDQPHSVTAADESFDSSPNCGPLDSDKCLGEGDTFSFVFEKPGTYTYYCRVHGLPDGTGMVGKVVVE